VAIDAKSVGLVFAKIETMLLQQRPYVGDSLPTGSLHHCPDGIRQRRISDTVFQNNILNALSKLTRNILGQHVQSGVHELPQLADLNIDGFFFDRQFSEAFNGFINELNVLCDS
jgi:hypothetical protein